MRCSKCGSTNVTVNTQPTSGYNLAGTFFVETKKICHCMACGQIGDSSSVAMDYEMESIIENALQWNDVPKLKNIKRKYRNFEWTPPTEDKPTSSTCHKFNIPSDPNFNIDHYLGTVKKYVGLEKSVLIPEGVLKIGDGAFAGSSITSVKIPGSVTSIGRGAFSHQNRLSSVVFSSSTVRENSANNTDNFSIGDHAFDYCSSLTSIAIPNGFKVIEKNAFNSCWNLVTVSIPRSITTIGESAFSCCFNLSSIKIPQGVTSIGESAFRACDKLVSISIPQSVTSIEPYVFSGCKQLASIAIPKSVTSIGFGAFENCVRLRTMTIPKDVTYIGIGAIEGCKKIKTIFFENPHGWFLKRVKGELVESVDEKILSNPKSAAKYIKKYCNDYSLCKKEQNQGEKS